MSTRYEDLGAELDAMRSEIDALDKTESPTDEQVTRMAALLEDWDPKHTEYEGLKARAEKLDAIRSAAVEPANRERGFEAPNVIVRSDPFDGLENLRHMAPAEARDRALQAFGDDVKLRGVTSKGHEALVERIEQEGVNAQMRGIAAHVLVHGSPAYRSAFDAWFQAGKTGQTTVFTGAEGDAVRASMALGGSTGGYTLPTLLDPTLIHTGTATRNNLRSISRVIEGTQNVWHGVSVGNVTTAWVAENTALSDGSPTFSNPSVTAAKLTAFVTGSYEIFEDSDLQAQMPGLIGEAFGFAESTAFVVGSGSNAPKGIVTAVSGTTASLVTVTTRGAFTAASAVDVFALVGALPSRYDESSTWVANKSWFNIVRQMSTGSQGSYFWTNFNNETVPGAQPLLGSPVVQASDMNTSFASGSIIAILGDWSQFVIYDRIGTSVEFVPQVFNSSGLPLGQRGLVAHKRVGSDVTDLNAFRLLKA